MKILVLSIEYPPLGGGASPFCKEMSELYSRKGHEVHVVSMHHLSLPKSEEIKGVKIHRIPCRRASISISNPVEHLLFIYFAIVFIRKMLKNETGQKFEVCHCHFLVPTGIIAIWLNIFHKIPFIVTIHGSDVPGYNPDRFKFLHLFTKPIITLIIKKANFVISPSIYLSSLLKSHISPSLHKKIKLIRYCFVSAALKRPKEKIIMSSGRLLKRKGFHTLIKSVTKYNNGYTVHIFGDGPEMSELQFLASKSKTKIVFHGWFDNQSEFYKRQLAKASIFVLVSSHENSSLSIMEAMDNECAIITSDKTGCYEAVNDIGICIPFNDVGRLELELEKLFGQPSKIMEYGLKAKQKHNIVYSPDHIYNSYHSLLMEIIGEPI